MTSFSPKFLFKSNKCSHVFLIIQFPELSNLKQSYFILRGGGGGGVSELTDRQGCAILALEVVPKNLFYQILCLLFQQEKLCLTNISSKNGQVAYRRLQKSINYEIL